MHLFFPRRRESTLLAAAILLLILAACARQPAPITHPTAVPTPEASQDPAAAKPSAVAPTTSHPESSPAKTARPTGPQPSPVPERSQAKTPIPTATSPAYAPLDPDLPPPPTAIPPPAPLLPRNENVTLFALLGNDDASRKGGRTDSIILAAVNPAAQTINLLSLPRDLYVVIPGWTMDRINLAYAHGGEQGAALFTETIAYNLGLPVDHTVRLGFDGFKRGVDALGGVELVVNCPVEDWRLRAPDLDPDVEDNWERYELSYGIQRLDGELALWYARSRRSSSDFDRGRRQQKILRALWQELRHSPAGLTRLPALVHALWSAVDTDLTLDQTVALAAQLPQLDSLTIQNYLLPREALHAWTVPGSGAEVQLLDWQTADPILRDFLGDPALNAARSAPIRVAIQSADYILYRQATENLTWYGFEAVYQPPSTPAPQETTITYLGPTLKGAHPDRLAWIFHQQTADIQLQPASAKDNIDYLISLAPDYNPCLNYLAGP